MNRYYNTLAFLSVLACFHSTTVAQTSAAQKTVWQDMDQAALDDAYTQSVWASNAKEVQARYKSRSENFLTGVTARRFLYGPSPKEGLDVYMPEKANGSILIFIHGGAWAGGSARDYAFVAALPRSKGVTVIIPDFSTASDVNGDLEALANEIRSVVLWAKDKAPNVGADPTKIFISGHSSGAHLAAVVMTTDWRAMGLSQDIIKGGILCSGMYDLKPVRLSARSKYISFTDKMEGALSPQRHIDLLAAPVFITYGGKESPEFQRQSKDFYSALQQSGKRSKLQVVDELNHFEMLETIADEKGALWQAVVDMLGINR